MAAAYGRCGSGGGGSGGAGLLEGECRLVVTVLRSVEWHGQCSTGTGAPRPPGALIWPLAESERARRAPLPPSSAHSEAPSVPVLLPRVKHHALARVGPARPSGTRWCAGVCRTWFREPVPRADLVDCLVTFPRAVIAAAEPWSAGGAGDNPTSGASSSCGAALDSATNLTEAEPDGECGAGKPRESLLLRSALHHCPGLPCRRRRLRCSGAQLWMFGDCDASLRCTGRSLQAALD